MRKSAVLSCVAFSLSLLTACSSDDSSGVENKPLESSGARTWVATEPTQCLTNPWEQDWLSKNNGDMAAYPRDLSWPRQLTPDEIEIITEYYAKQGVVVFETATRGISPSVCEACECDEGHTLYLLVGDRDVDRMIALGYRADAPQS